MTMNIGSDFGSPVTDYAKRLKEKQESPKTEEVNPGREAPKDEPPVYQDEYISSGDSGEKPSGLYRLGQDGHGRPKVFYDDPAKANAPVRKKPTEKSPVNKEDRTESCVTNTDRVDREIENLKNKVKLLKQQLTAASGEEQKAEELQKKLAAAQKELNRKDTDSYRRQNASYTRAD